MQLTYVPATFARLMVVAIGAALVLLLFTADVRAAGAPTLVRDINASGSSNPTSLTAVGSTLFFAANDGVHGNELWKTNGTAAGTKMVKNIRPYGKGSFPMNLTNVNGKLFFTANDGKHGRELWKSDGTKAGTVMVKDIHTGPSNQFGGNSILIHEHAFAIGDRLFFFVDSCCVGTQNLYISDGTAAGTYYLDQEEDFQLPDEKSVGIAGGKIYFVNGHWDGDSFDYRLWVSNGTEPGTHRVAGSPTSENMSILPNNGSKLYFYSGNRLWRSDGTKVGTKPLTTSGALPFAPDASVLMGKRLYFGESGMLGALWRTDGTAAGTREISGSPVAFLISTGGQLYFSAHGYLLTSDGTAAGTHDLTYFEGSWLRHLVAVGNKVCFFAPDEDADTWTLGASDGTAIGTHAVKSFVISTATDSPGASIGGRFFFAADDGTHGAELWRYTP